LPPPGLEIAGGRDFAAEAARARALLSDEQLMEAIRERCDEDAFEEIVARHAPGAHRTALACLGERAGAEDAVQECFLHLVRSRRSFRSGMRFAPWFYTLLRNACRDEIRRRRHRPQPRAELPGDAAEVPADAEFERAEQASAAHRAFAGLPELEREILTLRVHAGLDFPRIAAVVGLETEAAKKRAYRALERLRRVLVRP
jgi:RNA polymerase sigma-70 factor (ECF subfamily)